MTNLERIQQGNFTMTFNEFIKKYYKINVNQFIKLDYHEQAPIIFDYKKSVKAK